MSSYILRGITDNLRARLSDSGVLFYDWESDIFVEQAQLEPALKALNARVAEEKTTAYENMVELALHYGVTPAQRGTHRPTNEPTLDPATAASRAAYISAANYRLKQCLDEATIIFNSKKKALPAAQAKFFKAARESIVLSDKAAGEQLLERYADHYQRLAANPQVEAVRVTKDLILVYTKQIVATHAVSKSRHNLGKYLIQISTADGKLPIRFLNQTRIVTGKYEKMHGPYVYADGTALVSEMQETFVELIAQFEYATVLELAIQFLETVNDDQPGIYLDRWPTAYEAQTGQSK